MDYNNSSYFCRNQLSSYYEILRPTCRFDVQASVRRASDLVISLINALLPLDKDHQVKSVEYIPIELVPDNPLKKNSIVDVRCKDSEGRQFLVEMQMIWSEEFKQRVLFNACKAYVRQLDKKEQYELLQPVYSLNLVNDIFQKILKNIITIMTLPM